MTTYRVTWVDLKDNVDDPEVTHTEDFTDIDQGYDFYLRKQKRAGVHKVTWGSAP